MDIENRAKPDVSRAIELLRSFSFTQASDEAHRVLADNPCDTKAQFVLLLASFEVPSFEALYELNEVLESDKFRRAQENARGEFSDMLKAFSEKYIEKREQKWLEAEALFSAGKYEAAQLCYLFLGSYKDSVKRWKTCQEKLGDEAMKNRSYSRAVDYYKESGNQQKLADARRPLDAVEDFKKEVGNPNTYLKRMLYNKYPQIWNEYERLCANPKRSLFESRESKSYKAKKINAANKANNYYTVSVAPKIREIREELRAKYADRIDAPKLEGLIKELKFRF